MRMLPKQLLHTLLHPRPLNTLSPLFETTGLEGEQQRNRSQSPHMLVVLPASSPFFETKGLELEPQTNRSQSLHTPVSCCNPSRHFTLFCFKYAPLFAPITSQPACPRPPIPPSVARARVQTRWPKVRVPESSHVFFPDIRLQSFIHSFVVVASVATLHADSCALQRLNCWAQHLRTQQRALLGRRVLYPAKYFAGSR